MELEKIKSPSDLRKLNDKQCKELADEIRWKIVHTVAKNGGHLSSNLGMVEITMALHRVFDFSKDKLVFDVGHQCYAHKLLTGRYDQFDTLRTYGGLSGFPKKDESEYDCFETGHASTAISAALGMARARDALGQTHHVVAVVGDGALTGGMCYEALNDAGNTKTRLIVILNDNEMSIAPNVGALSKYLSQLRASTPWYKLKTGIKYGLKKIPWIGNAVYDLLLTIKRSIKSIFVDEKFFGTLGFRYIGPIDGQDEKTLEYFFERAKQFDEPIVVHCSTTKGYGYSNAESKPEYYHGVAPFVTDGDEEQPTTVANGQVAADTLLEMMWDDSRIHAVTAAMPLGTSVCRIERQFPQRVHDVGIAEEHAVTLCAGMATGGLRPYFFVYSTFLQRGYDQVLHDCCMQRLPVMLLIDRAGLGNEDGQSHQGLFDIAYLRHMPNMTILAPRCTAELCAMIRATSQMQLPCAIRYAKKSEEMKNHPYAGFTLGQWETLSQGDDAELWAVGSMVPCACRVADKLRREGICLTVINCSTIKPLDTAYIQHASARGRRVLTMEEHIRSCGFGSEVAEYCTEQHLPLALSIAAVEDQFVPQGDHASLLSFVGLSDERIEERVRKMLGKETEHE